MHVHMERTINAPAEVVWQILGPEFAQISDWANFVKTSVPLTAADAPDDLVLAPAAPFVGRETKTKATLQEFIIAYDADAMTLTFDAVGLPPIVRLGRDVQTVHADGPESSRLTFEIDFDFVGPFAILGSVMRKRMAKSLGSVMDDLKTEAERRHNA